MLVPWRNVWSQPEQVGLTISRVIKSKTRVAPVMTATRLATPGCTVNDSIIALVALVTVVIIAQEMRRADASLREEI